MNLSERFPVTAAAVAFILAAIGLLASVRHATLTVFALVPLLAGIGIARRHVWSAYGFALFTAAQMILTPLALMRGTQLGIGRIAAALAVNLVLIALFIVAGRVLSQTGAPRGSAPLWIAVACLYTLPFFFVEPFAVPTSGMEDTLLVGDRILALVFPRLHPAQGDIVVLRYPADRRQIFIKRVIGVPGDRIRIADRQLYRNGAPLAEPYAVHKRNYHDTFPRTPNDRAVPPGPRLRDLLEHHVTNGEAVVPPDSYFVLGDDRDNSLDSRYWGFLPISDLLGRAFLIYDSQEQQAANGVRQVHTRWSRLFKTL